MNWKQSDRKKRLYVIGIALFAIVILGTPGALELCNITIMECLWQITVSLIGWIFFWDLLRLEFERAAICGRLIYYGD